MLAWLREHGCDWDHNTVWRAAQGGHLELLEGRTRLKLAGCTSVWPQLLWWVARGAARFGHLPVLQWAVAGGITGLGHALAHSAAGGGHIHVLEWLARATSFHIDTSTVRYALRNGHTPVLRWLHAAKCWPDPSATLGYHSSFSCDLAAGRGHWGAVRWAHEFGGLLCTAATARAAAAQGRLAELQWAAVAGVLMDTQVCEAAVAAGHPSLALWAWQHGAPLGAGSPAQKAVGRLLRERAAEMLSLVQACADLPALPPDVEQLIAEFAGLL